MGGLIALSEIARNLVLPAIAVLGAMIAWWQARMSRRKNGFDLIVKAGELHSRDQRERRLASYAALLEAAANPDSRQMAEVMFSSYLSQDDDLAVLTELRRLASGSSVARWVDLRIETIEAGNAEV